MEPWVAPRSRRSFLKLAASVGISVGTVLAAGDILSKGFLQKPIMTLSESSLGSELQTSNMAALTTVKVYYSMMSQDTSLTEEDFVLQSPATVQELIDTVIVRHPLMAQMMQTMLILLNGVATKPMAPLVSGDVVQFIPLSIGG
jgi:molybdopterin converting factor small subunit